VLKNLAVLFVLEPSPAQLNEALRICEEALVIDQTQLDRYDPEMARILGTMGLVRWQLDDYPLAEELLQAAVDVDEKAWGPNHPILVFDIHNLATVYDDANQYERAKELYRRALQLANDALGPDVPATKKIQFDLEWVTKRELSAKAGK